MSYAEILCEKSLRLIFENSAEIYKNYRPDWLKNPKTGKNLELDFYLPHIRVALEIQGPHHYNDLDQIYRDKIKEEILILNKITLIKLSIFQISPTLIRRKILNYKGGYNSITLLKEHDKKWESLPEIKKYMHDIIEQYGQCDCIVSPYINEVKEKRNIYLNTLDKQIMSNVEYTYMVNGVFKKITPVEIISRKTIKCRIFGTDKFVFIKKKKFFNNCVLC